MASDPLLLTTAIEAVVRAGDIQMARLRRRPPHRQEGHHRSRHRGRRRGRAHVPRAHRRALSRSPRARRGDGRQRDGAGGPVLGVRSDRRHHELRARPADLLRVARARDRRRRRGGRRLRSEPPGALHGGARRRRVPERPAAARVVGRSTLVDAHAGHRISVRRALARGRNRRTVRARSSGRARAVRRLGSAAIDLCYVAAGRMDGFWERRSRSRGTSPAARCIVAEAGGRVTEHGRVSRSRSRGRHVLATNGRIHDAMLDVIRA